MFTILIMVGYAWEYFGTAQTRAEAEAEIARWRAKYPGSRYRVIEGD